MNLILRKIRNLDSHTIEVFKKAIPTTFIKLVGIVLAIIISVFIARTLGAEGLGIINLSNRIIAIFLVLGMFGMRQVLIKEIAIGHSKGDLKRIGDLLKTAYLFNVLISVVISVLLIFLSPWLANNFFNMPELRWILVLSFLAFPFQIISQIFSSGLTGYRKIWQASLADQTLSVFIVFLILCAYFILSIEITTIKLIIAYVFSRLTTALFLGVYWQTIFISNFKKHQKIKELFKTAFPIFLVSVTAKIYKNIDIIMIGWLCSAKEVGVYTVSSRIAILSGFILSVANSVISPKFATLYDNNNKKELQKLVQYVTTALLLSSIIVLSITIGFGNFILSIWGLEFRSGYFVLITLAIGQFFNVATGAVGTLLTMTGFEKKLLSVNTLFMILNLVLNFLLTTAYGIEGAAYAFTISIIGMNLTRTFFVYKYIGIHIFPFVKIIRLLKLKK